jgi:hypothetical protein
MTMADAPQIKASGAGTAREAARLGQQIATGVTAALAGQREPINIDVLRLQLRSGSGAAEMEAAIRAAIERHRMRRER